MLEEELWLLSLYGGHTLKDKKSESYHLQYGFSLQIKSDHIVIDTNFY